MSTSRSRLTRSIQEIAKRDPDLRRAIEATKPRGDQPSAAGVGTSDAERDRICCDGSTSDNVNPGTEERDTSEGGQDGLNPDDTADISDMGPGILSGLHDCATGEPICFLGGECVPPEGWQDCRTPEPDPSYTPGKYWVAFGVFGWVCGGVDGPSAIRLLPEGRSQTQFDCGDPGSRCLGEAVNRGLCDDPIDPSLTYYGDPEWPSDGCTSIYISGGRLVGSKYDPENDGTYSKPMSEIQLCDDFGNSFYLSPSAGGGWKTINATKDAGYLWGSNGQKIAHINGNEYSDPSI